VLCVWKEGRDNLTIGWKAVGDEDQAFTLTLDRKLAEEVISGQGIAVVGKEPGEDKVMYWITGSPEDFMAVVEEKGFIDVDFTG
jgi:hypothetical protein